MVVAVLIKRILFQRIEKDSGARTRFQREKDQRYKDQKNFKYLFDSFK